MISRPGRGGASSRNLMHISLTIPVRVEQRAGRAQEHGLGRRRPPRRVDGGGVPCLGRTIETV